jgi:predicted tellurium resistance membrane protein TerC
MIALLTSPEAWAALLTLTALEIVLGIDNVVFISVLVARLDPAQAKRARQIGLSLALLFRIALLFALTKLIGLATPVFSVLGNGFSWHDIILIGGGLFLIAKATHEMHAEIEGDDENPAAQAARAVFSVVIAQVVVIDIVFSIDSIVTAIGMAQDIRIMIAAVLIAVAIMYAASAPVSAFIAAHPTTKVLALAFLVLIGVALVADGFDFHVPRGYIYFAMAFAAAVEAVNIAVRRRRRARRE